MTSLPLSHAIHLGLHEINRGGTYFNPDIASLYADLSYATGSGGVIAITPENLQSGDRPGYDLAELSPPDVSNIDATIHDIWECAKEHYGLTAVTLLTGAGGIPVSKLHLGHKVYPGSSKYTNLVSHFGLKFFPMTTLPHDSMAAKIAKKAFGTIRVFGIVGRALPFAAAGLAVIDAISIGACAYEARRGR
jgi:hypothetical protein